MKIHLLILLLLVITFEVSSQTPSTDESGKALKCVIKDKRPLFVRPTVDSYYIAQIKQYLSKDTFVNIVTYPDKGLTLHDTIFLNKAERHILDSSIAALSAFAWTNEDIHKIGLPNAKFAGPNELKRSPTFDFIVYTIAKPIMIRNNSICFVFFNYACGALCGQGALMILTSKNHQWKHWRTIVDIVS